MDGLDKNKAKGILRLSRSNLTLLIRAITNHNFLGAHQNKVDTNISTCYRFCEEENETFVHLLTDCRVLRQTQQDIFLDTPPLEQSDWSWSIKKVLQFINSPSVLHALATKSGMSLVDSEDDLWQTCDRPY